MRDYLMAIRQGLIDYELSSQTIKSIGEQSYWLKNPLSTDNIFDTTWIRLTGFSPNNLSVAFNTNQKVNIDIFIIVKM